MKKLQAPTSKLQRSSKHQAPNARRRRGGAFKYWDADGASLKVQETPGANGAGRHPFDLEERTAVFGENIVRFAKKIPRDPAKDRLIAQLVGAGTSVGANYCEANEGVSKKDFRCTIGRCVKEAKETKTLSANDCGRRAEARRRRTALVSRGEGTALNLRDNVSRMNAGRSGWSLGLGASLVLGAWCLVL